MKKWHMEGILNTSPTCGQRLVVPDENQMYGRIRGYVAARRRESALIEMLRKTVGWFLSRI